MLGTRVLSGIALVLILGAAIYMGGYTFWILLLFISETGIFELYRALNASATGNLNGGGKEQENKATQKEGGSWKIGKLEIAGMLSAAAYYISLIFVADAGGTAFAFPLFILLISLIVLMLIFVSAYPKYHSSSVIHVLFGEIYVASCLGCLYVLRGMEQGILLTLLVFVSSWVCDTFAYFVGRTIGKHKLAPVLSPKKSIEGAVGGVAGSFLVGLLLGHFMDFNSLLIAGISAAGAIVSQCGDLFASGIKRNYGIKDYGTLIPGHGGILDRFDSVIITAPIIYILSFIFLGTATK